MKGETQMNSDAWQDAAVEQIRRFFAAAPGVQAVSVFGSSKEPTELLDEWSDVDVLVVLDTDALSDYHPDTGWVNELGDLYTYEQSSGPFTHVTRCCFRDGRQVDFVFTTAAAIENLSQWPQLPWWNGARILFSRSEAASAALKQTAAQPPPASITPKAFQAMTRGFRFKGLLAISKIARDDLLIALHLILEMQQDCCVLGMLIRDRNEGTSVHQEGGIGNGFASSLPPIKSCTAHGLLDAISQTAIVYDGLASEWSTGYSPENGPLNRAIQRARKGRR